VIKKNISSDVINCTFFCVQPIHIEDESLISLLGKPFNQELLEEYIEDSEPGWITKFNKKQLYNYVYTIKLDSVDNGVLKEQLNSSFDLNGKFLGENLNSETTFYLKFDSRLVYFNLMYELSFDFTTQELSSILEQNSDNDLYNIVRNTLVKENDTSKISSWAETIRDNSLKKIHTLIEELYEIRLDKENLFIENNTGNITNKVVFPSQISQREEFVKLNEQLILQNQIAERKVVYDEPLVLKNSIEHTVYHEELYFFGGRFHTITLNPGEQSKYRYFTIQFQMQYMWFYLKKINFILDCQYNKVRQNSKIKDIENNTLILDELISIIEILSIHNERFKMVIDRDNRIYSAIESKWNIESLLGNSHRYIGFFKDYLKRLYARKTSKAEQRQNKILLFITLFQFIALLSVWNDYLVLLDDGLQDKADEIIPLFGNYATLELFNLYLPVGFMLIIVFMFIYIFRNKD